MRFHIVSPAYNPAPFIEQMIASVRCQTHQDFRHTVVDDLSTDDTVSRALRAIGDDPRIQVVRNEHKRYALGGCSRGIAESQPADEEVVVVLDGDDRLASADVLARLDRAYADPNCWLTYGSYSGPQGVRDRSCQPFSASTVQNALYRKRGYIVPHLRTFRYKLWKAIPASYLTITQEEVRRAKRRALLRGRLRQYWYWRDIDAADLVDPSGRFVRRLCDKAPAYAMLEMACHHARFIDDLVLLYSNYEKDLGFRRSAARLSQKWYTRLIRDIIEHRAPLAPLESDISGDSHTVTV